MNRAFVLIRCNNFPSSDFWIPIVSKNEKDLWNWIEKDYNDIINKVDPEKLIVNIDRFSLWLFTYPGVISNSTTSIRYEICKTNMVGEEDE